MEFPQYRKYKNEASYFKIFSFESFQELKKEVSGFRKYNFSVKILPDRNFVNDMLMNYGDHWESIEEAEYDKILRISESGRESV